MVLTLDLPTLNSVHLRQLDIPIPPEVHAQSLPDAHAQERSKEPHLLGFRKGQC